ncbi:TniQ family protein [Sulfurimonas sp.]
MFIVEPYADELLSSWFLRLARKNRTNVSTIICHIFKGNILAKHTSKLHIKDVDLYVFNDVQKDMVLTYTGIPVDTLQMFKYIGYLDEKVDRYNKKWITESKTHIHNAKKFYGARFCPQCLKENVYIPQQWRLMLYNICHKHHSYLLTMCPKCKATFMYNDNGYVREMYECYNCHFDLRKADILLAKPKDIHTQTKLLNILEKGFYKLHQRYYYSIGLFVLLRKLLNTIMTINSIDVKYINQLTPIQLARLLTHSIFLLDKFPMRINRYYKTNSLTDIHNILSWDTRDKQSFILPSWFLFAITYRVLVYRGTRPKKH